MESLYDQVLNFVQALRPQAFVIHENTRQPRNVPDAQVSRLWADATSHSTVIVNGLKYGASLDRRGKKACYAFVDGRHAVIIDRLITVTAGNQPPIHCAIVRPFAAVIAPELPWHHL